MRRVIYTVFALMCTFSFGCDVAEDKRSSSVDIDNSIATITGTVMEINMSNLTHGINPLALVTISTDPETEEVISGSGGLFAINAPNGRYCLSVKSERHTTFTTWIDVSDEFHPDITLPVKESDGEDFTVYEAMLTDSDIGEIDGDYAMSVFPADTKEICLIVDHTPLDEDAVVDLVWLKGSEEILRMEDIGSELSGEFSCITTFSIFSEGDSMPNGHYSVQLEYKRQGARTIDEYQAFLSLPFYVKAPESEDFSEKKFDITVVNERDETVSVHLDGEFRFELMAEFLPEKWRKKIIEDVPGGEHTLTVFDEQGDLIASETFILDSDVTFTIKPGWGL